MHYYAVLDLLTFTQMLVIFFMTIINNCPLIEPLHVVGETSPTKVEAAIGSSFNISCSINPDVFLHKNSNNLYFDNGRTNELFPRKNIMIINNTMIVYEVRNATEQDTKYRCKCDTDAIMETSVYVGTLPKPITNFMCQSYYFEYMVCNFTKPINPISTQYNVTFYTTSVQYIYTPDCQGSKDGLMVTCNTTFHNYRPRDELYHYRINAENTLGKMEEQKFIVNNWEIMVPPKPDDDLKIEVFVDSVNVMWRMANWEDYRVKGLEWEILIKPENFTTVHYQGPDRPDKRGLLRLFLSNLKYPHWFYTLKMRVRVNVENAVWSEQVVRQFKTAARPPDRSPSILPGSFYIDSMETTVTIYWEQLAFHEYNGDNFSYIVTNVKCNGKPIELKPVQLELNMAMFLWNKDSHYEFEIRSHNHKGISSEASRITINPLSKINVKEFTPEAIHNVYHASNRTYTLSWKAPKYKENVLNYTVYWCYAKRGLPNECKGSIHFHQVPSNQYNFTIQTSLQEHVLNLAVSADYFNINTGLHWTECSSDVNSDLVKMDPDVQAISASSIKVHWALERVCQSILEGFNLTYCEIESQLSVSLHEQHEHVGECLEEPITKTLPKDWKRYEISGLKPYTKYNITMLMFSRLKKGKVSDSYLVRTLEGTPSPPRQLEVLHVTNSSAIIRWQPPSQLNGILRKYTIILNTDKYEVNASVLTFKLNNLAGFTAYKVYVLAHTVNSSMPSNDRHFTTLIGYPSPPGHAANSHSGIQWSKPQNPRGNVEFYEVNITRMHNSENVGSRISVVIGDTWCNFKQPACLDHEYKTLIEVRAVNAAPLNVVNDAEVSEKESVINIDDDVIYNEDEDKEDLLCKGGRLDEQSRQDLKRYHNSSQFRLHKSPWQSIATYACSSSRLSKIITIALLVIIISFIMMVALYMARRMYNKMANINCTLPAGLELYFSKDTTANFGGGGGLCAKGMDAHSITVGNLSSKILNSSVVQSAEEQWLVATGRQEYNSRNEHHYLLASICQDSGYLDKEHCNSSLSATLKTNISDEEKEQLQQFEPHPYYKTSTASVFGRDYVKFSQNLFNNGSAQHPRKSLSENSNTYISPDSTLLSRNDNANKINTCDNAAVLLNNQNWQKLNDCIDNTSNVNSCGDTVGGYILVQNINLATVKPSHKDCTLPNRILETSESLTSSSYKINHNSNGYSTLESLEKCVTNQKDYGADNRLTIPNSNSEKIYLDLINTLERADDTIRTSRSVHVPISECLTQQELSTRTDTL